MATRKTHGLHVDQMRDQIRPRPREQQLEHLTQRDAARGRDQNEQSGRAFAVHREIADHRKRGNGNERETAETGDVAHDVFEPGRTDRVRQIGGIAQRQQEPSIEGIGVAAHDHAGDPDKAREQRRDQSQDRKRSEFRKRAVAKATLPFRKQADHDTPL